MEFRELSDEEWEIIRPPPPPKASVVRVVPQVRYPYVSEESRPFIPILLQQLIHLNL
jgi:hypothetical protein